MHKMCRYTQKSRRAYFQGQISQSRSMDSRTNSCKLSKYIIKRYFSVVYVLFFYVKSMMAMGNSRAKAIYECNLADSYRRSQSDSAMEQFIRAKYEQRKWIDKNWSPSPLTIPPNVIIIDDLIYGKRRITKKNSD